MAILFKIMLLTLHHLNTSSFFPEVAHRVRYSYLLKSPGIDNDNDNDECCCSLH